jgi:hypothetical protein
MKNEERPELTDLLQAYFTEEARRTAHLAGPTEECIPLRVMADAPQSGLSDEELRHLEGCDACMRTARTSFRGERPAEWVVERLRARGGAVARLATLGDGVEELALHEAAAPASLFARIRLLVGARRARQGLESGTRIAPRFLALGLAAAAALLIGVVVLNHGWQPDGGSMARKATPEKAKEQINDGVLVASIGENGTIDLRGGPSAPEWRDRAALLLREGAIQPSPSAHSVLEQTRGTVRGGSPGGATTHHGCWEGVPVPISPARTAIRTLRPTLHWKGVADAPGYTVVLQDTSGNSQSVTFPVGKSEAYEIHPGYELRPGHTYAWQVEAHQSAGGTAISDIAYFTTLDAESLKQVAELEHQFNGSALLLTALYESRGLYDDARDQLDALARANPKSNEVARLSAGLDALRK